MRDTHGHVIVKTSNLSHVSDREKFSRSTGTDQSIRDNPWSWALFSKDEMTWSKIRSLIIFVSGLKYSVIQRYRRQCQVHGEYTGPIWTHVFSNRLFQLFSHIKIDKFGIVGKRRFSSFIWRGLEINFQSKQKISALG